MSTKSTINSNVSYQAEKKKFQKQFYTYNTGVSLPLLYSGSSELYESENGENFIHKCGNTHYMYSLVNKHIKQPKHVNLYKVQDIIRLLAIIDAEKEIELSPTSDFESCYQDNLSIYEKLFKEYYTWDLHKFRCHMDFFAFVGTLPIEFWKYADTEEHFLRTIKTIYFYDDAASALYKHRYGFFKITKLNSFKKEELEKYVLVAGNKLHKLKFDAFKDIVCCDEEV